MPNISGEYTLAEAAGKLGVSPAWIGKVRKLTGIGGSLGTQGKKASFTEDDLAQLDTVSFLRAMGLDYSDIKHFYKIENEIINLNKEVKKGDLASDMTLCFHRTTTIYLHKRAEDINKKDMPGYKEKLQTYRDKLKEYVRIYDVVIGKIDKFLEKMNQMKRARVKIKI